jgi:hypothetical protein
MVKKVVEANITVGVSRDGQSISVKKGQVFDFTKDEIADIEKAFGEDALRNPKNEDAAGADEPKKADKKADKKGDGL